MKATYSDTGPFMDDPRYLAWTVKEKGVGLEFPGCLFGYSDHWLIYRTCSQLNAFLFGYLE